MSVFRFLDRFKRRLAEFDPVQMIQEREKWVAVDFDNTLVDWNLDSFGEPKIYYMSNGKQITSIDVLERIRRVKKIIIHSCRTNEDQSEAVCAASIKQMMDWLAKHRVPYDAIWRAKGKPVACAYWDDMGWRADNAGTEVLLKELGV